MTLAPPATNHRTDVDVVAARPAGSGQSGSWHDGLTVSPKRLLVVLLLTVLFVPPRRYAFHSPLPSSLEPFRLVFLGVLFACLLGPLVDRRWQRPRFVFGTLLLGYLVASILSVAVNVEYVTSLTYLPNAVLTSLLFVLVVFGVFFVVRQLLTSPAVVRTVLRTLVVSGALLSVLAAIEVKLRKNVFDIVFAHLPILTQVHDASPRLRGGHFRAIVSAEQAIPAGVLFAMILPLGVYLLFRDGGPTGRRQWLWLCCTVLLVLGIASTLSRTPLLMMAVMVLLGLVLRPRAMLRLAPLVPVLLVLALVGAPSSVKTLYQYIFPKGGLVAQQTGVEGSSRSTGRLTDLKQGLKADLHHPVVGQGFGTLIVTGPHINAPITDNTYLDRFTETGLIGLVSLLAVYVVPARRLWRLARSDPGPDGDLAAAVSLAVVANAVAIALHGAWAFEQELVVLFTVLAIGSWLVSRRPAEPAQSGLTGLLGGRHRKRSQARVAVSEGG